MSEELAQRPVHQAVRLTAEWWDRVGLVECTDDVVDYHRYVEVVSIGVNEEVRTFVQELSDEQLAQLGPVVSKLALAMSRERAGRKTPVDTGGEPPGTGVQHSN